MLKSRKELDAELDAAARTWLAEALAEAAHAAAPREPARAGSAGAETARPEGTGDAATSPYASPPWELRYAAAGRHCGPAHADSVRSLLLIEARAPLPSVTRLYEQGTAAERRAVLLTLDRLDLGATALPLVEDALRTNDTRLVAAAVGPYAAAHLDPHAWRHAVLKCLFTGVPLDAVARLGERARGDDELARMLSDFAAERTAAGRDVPADLDTALGLARTTPAAPTEES
ncbi:MULTISPECIES: EboA domain-containing protein [unclassified Streptomyces]|uniref:EboA domain-containing protein n=1 Tax=unclassified Streptomyces TaxID=2593676 RepID=UPI0035DFCE7A